MQAVGSISKTQALTVDDYVAGVLAGDRTVLARAITLIESQARPHQVQAQDILQRLLPHTGKAKRIGISGAPGVGKSTFIEALGCHLIDNEHRVAVLTIDPSSAISGGSVLADKTRMDRLSRELNAFIRPSPAGGSLGGVAGRTRETMLVCEAAGFDTIIVESLGVGQAEIALRSMVDFFLLLLLPGAGDELQGIKKGIMEIADAVLINKADGDNRSAAQQARLEQESALRCLLPATSGWKTEAGLCSARTGEGVAEAWKRIEAFYRELEPKGIIAARRRQQMLDWLADLLREELQRDFYQDPRVQSRLPGVRKAVLQGEMTAVQAAATLLAARNGQSKISEL
ncbi:MAG: methylmalonyl Co-A mutase-associated GTPase MeaB [Verrucomicrobiota bacterium]|jgi:LAO/AO transport system kinase